MTGYRFNQIVIVNGRAYGYVILRDWKKWVCKYLAYLPDNKLLKEKLKIMFPNVSIISNIDNRWNNLRSDLKRNSEILSHWMDLSDKPMYDFTAELRNIKIDDIFKD